MTDVVTNEGQPFANPPGTITAPIETATPAPAPEPAPRAAWHDNELPLIERKASPELAKEIAEAPSWQKAVRVAGKAASDTHKLERYKALAGAPQDMTVTDADFLEKLVDDSGMRDWNQPVHPSKDRVHMRGFTFGDQRVPRLDETIDPGAPVLRSRGGQLHGADVALREGLLGAAADKARAE